MTRLTSSVDSSTEEYDHNRAALLDAIQELRRLQDVAVAGGGERYSSDTERAAG